MPQPKFEAVAVAVAAYGSHDPRRFTYTVPEHLHGRLRPGHLVTVPFGERTTYGVVTAPVTKQPDFELRAVERLLHPTPLVSPTHLGPGRLAGGYLHRVGVQRRPARATARLGNVAATLA